MPHIVLETISSSASNSGQILKVKLAKNREEHSGILLDVANILINKFVATLSLNDYNIFIRAVTYLQ